MKRLSLLAIAASLFAAACGSSSPSSPTPTQPTFTADLKPSNETTTVVGPETSGTGNATITFNTTKDAAGNITAASATFVVNMSGFPAGTSITAAHIHPGAAGVAGGVLVSTALTAGEAVLANGSGSFTKTVNTVDPASAQNIINNPAGFYFNIHTAANPGGVARGQLVKVQ
jgi:CHRD domain